MSNKSDYFFLNLKQLYPHFSKPAEIDEEIWAELLEPFRKEDIRAALKSYRKSNEGAYIPTVTQFKDYLHFYKPKVVKDDLPLSPESYLMEEDIKNNRCKYLFPIYARAVEYVLNTKVKEAVGEKAFKKLSRGAKYRTAVDFGLFGDFDKILDMTAKEYHHV